MAVEFEMRETFEAAPEDVFGAITDLDAMRVWMPNLVQIELLTKGALQVGSRWRETRKMYGKEASEVFEVTRFEPPYQLELDVDGAEGSSGSVRYRFRYQLDGQGARATVLTLYGSIEGKSKIVECMMRLFLRSMKRGIGTDLRSLQTYLEQRSQNRSTP